MTRKKGSASHKNVKNTGEFHPALEEYDKNLDQPSAATPPESADHPPMEGISDAEARLQKETDEQLHMRAEQLAIKDHENMDRDQLLKLLAERRAEEEEEPEESQYLH